MVYVLKDSFGKKILSYMIIPAFYPTTLASTLSIHPSIQTQHFHILTSQIVQTSFSPPPS